MSLAARIDADLKDAMRARDQHKLAVLRAIRGELIKESKAGGEVQLTDDLAQKVVKRLVKQRQEAAESFRSGGRQDLAEKEEADLPVLEAYLPEPLSEGELETIVDRAILDAGARGPKDMGMVMKTLMPLLAETGKDVDNRAAADKVRAKLQDLG